ncbi:uncharacterized protein RAG0_11027 [Rhynchosporium agropyri]|uniref:Uncharacterized protein n=1 Tax=Rhynchosporium agropyri TaxID=914238 RepID=A0A1E1L2B4_9HELO|nr:uncharacterized protein RAG0_11027 [Rhynchosporium agropyri]
MDWGFTYFKSHSREEPLEFPPNTPLQLRIPYLFPTSSPA